MKLERPKSLSRSFAIYHESDKSNSEIYRALSGPSREEPGYRLLAYRRRINSVDVVSRAPIHAFIRFRRSLFEKELGCGIEVIYLIFFTLLFKIIMFYNIEGRLDL